MKKTGKARVYSCRSTLFVDWLQPLSTANATSEAPQALKRTFVAFQPARLKVVPFPVVLRDRCANDAAALLDLALTPHRLIARSPPGF